MQKLIADVLSFLRVLATWPVMYYSLHHDWTLVFVFLALGWGTDLLDGRAAKRYGSFSETVGLDADGLADTALAFGSTLVPVIYYWHVLGLGISLAVVYGLSVISGSVMVFWAMSRAERDSVARIAVAVNMILFHGALQIVATMLWFAYMAAGWWLCGVTMAILGIVINRQAPKISGWLKGRLTPYGQ